MPSEKMLQYMMLRSYAEAVTKFNFKTLKFCHDLTKNNVFFFYMCMNHTVLVFEFNSLTK